VLLTHALLVLLPQMEEWEELREQGLWMGKY
jgi:hypothetical protein